MQCALFTPSVLCVVCSVQCGYYNILMDYSAETLGQCAFSVYVLLVCSVQCAAGVFQHTDYKLYSALHCSAGVRRHAESVYSVSF